MSEQKQLNIFQRVNEVRKAIGYIRKEKSVSTGQGSYLAITHDQVTGLVRQHLIDQGIVITTSLVEGEFDKKEEGAKQRLYRSVFSIMFINCDNPEDRFSVLVPAHALDNGDKAVGKAMSYATKYAIVKTFTLEAGDDEESRYQTEDFDVTAHVDHILTSDTMDELKERFTASYRAAEEARDRDAMKTIISAKETAKARIVKESAK